MDTLNFSPSWQIFNVLLLLFFWGVPVYLLYEIYRTLKEQGKAQK
ncbi:hypothetical protein ACI75Y_07460 [Capnocytophaga stomatis]